MNTRTTPRSNFNNQRDILGLEALRVEAGSWV